MDLNQMLFDEGIQAIVWICCLLAIKLPFVFLLDPDVTVLTMAVQLYYFIQPLLENYIFQFEFQM